LWRSTSCRNAALLGASGLRVAVELLQGKEIKQSELQGEAGEDLVEKQNAEQGLMPVLEEILTSNR
jgi:hypothetical protein